MRRLLTNWVLYPAFLVVVMVGVTKVLHWRYLQRITPVSLIPDPPPPAGIDPATSARIGALSAPRRGSFLLAPRDKPPGTVRIGAFGDSFTYGLEVDEGLDWPSQLGILLRDRGDIPVDVLNFGNPGFGFHQMHMMAELVAPPFGLDYAVFAPLPTNWVGRDLSFSFWAPGMRPRLGFHSRYVLAGDELALVDVVGRTELERFAAYTRFVPPLRYLRFDERPPPFLQAWLPAGRTIRNPFYYSGLPREEEVAETYRRLLRREVSMASKAVVIETLDDLGKIVGSDPRLTPHLLRRPVPKRFPYSAPRGHWSPWGQRLVAEEVARALGVATEQPVEVVDTARDPTTPPLAVTNAPLDTYELIRIELGGVAVGSLYQHRRGDFVVTRVDRLPPDTRYLIAFAAPEQPLVDAVFIPLARRPEADSLTIDLGDGRTATAPLVWVDPAIARVDLCTRQMLGERAGTVTQGGCPLAIDWDSSLPRHPLVVWAGDQPLADVGENLGPYPAGTLWIRGTYFRSYANGNLSGHAARVPPDGAISLVLQRTDLPPRSVPFGRYRRASTAPASGASTGSSSCPACGRS